MTRKDVSDLPFNKVDRLYLYAEEKYPMSASQSYKIFSGSSTGCGRINGQKLDHKFCISISGEITNVNYGKKDYLVL